MEKYLEFDSGRDKMDVFRSFGVKPFPTVNNIMYF